MTRKIIFKIIKVDMKKINLIFLLLVGCLIVVKAQERIAISTFSYVISEDFLTKLDPYQPITTREKEKTLNMKKLFEKLLLEKTYGILQSQLANKEDHWLDMEAMSDFVAYNQFNFPNPLFLKKVIKKAIAVNMADKYVNFTFYLNTEFVLVGTKIKPALDSKMTVFNTSAKKVNTFGSEYKYERPFSSKSVVGERFDKMENEHIEKMVVTLLPAIEKCVGSLLDQFYPQRN